MNDSSQFTPNFITTRIFNFICRNVCKTLLSFCKNILINRNIKDLKFNSDFD